MSRWPKLSALERRTFRKLPRWRYERHPGGIARAVVFLEHSGAVIRPRTLQDLGRFLNFDGAENTDIGVELRASSPHVPVRLALRACDILAHETRAAGRKLQFSLAMSSRQMLRGLTNSGLKVSVHWAGGASQSLLRSAADIHASGALSEVVLHTSPARTEALETIFQKLAARGIPGVSVQMEYAQKWSRYEYGVLERVLSGLRRNGWQVGGLRVRMRESMCRKGRANSHCGAGVTKVAVGPDGALYPCHRFVSDRRRIIGTTALGFWPGVLGLHRYNPQQNPDCQGCGLISACDSGCIWLNLRETGRMDKTTSAVCEFTKMLWAEGIT